MSGSVEIADAAIREVVWGYTCEAGVRELARHSGSAKRVSPHVVRHTTAMHLLQAGVDVAAIALWLGHERLETTHYYVEADLQLKERALRSSNRSVNGRSGSRPTPPC